jgi:uncharacterized membrane protein YjjB (DUF3815 family)
MLSALSLAISIEYLPFFAVFYAGIAFAFIFYVDVLRSMLLWLAGGLALGLVVFSQQPCRRCVISPPAATTLPPRRNSSR